MAQKVSRTVQRIDQIILIVTFVGFCWLAMQAVHEFGHVLGAWITRGEVIRVYLHPAIISRTDIGYNPNPLLIVWAGPIVGCLFPLAIFSIARLCRFPGVYLFRFFAGFCLIANGVYIAFGSSEGYVDSGVMISCGSPRWLLVAFGLASVSLGLYLWHRQGRHFGLGDAGGKVDRQAVICSALLFLTIVGLELTIGKL